MTLLVVLRLMCAPSIEPILPPLTTLMMMCNFESAMASNKFVILGYFNYNYVLDRTL